MAQRGGSVVASLAVSVGIVLFLLGVLLFALAFLVVGGLVVTLLALGR
jgi:hypothetical protein